MDYFVSSDWFEAHYDAKAEDRYTEQLVRFDANSFAFARPEFSISEAAVEELRSIDVDGFQARDGLDNPARVSQCGVRYLIPQTLPKFHPSFDSVIRRLLERDGNSDAANHTGAPVASDPGRGSCVVIVFNKEKYFWKERLRRRFNNTVGMAGQRQDSLRRILFVPSLTRGEFASLVDSSTILLDPFPFGGGVTSLEAFSLCKPVVTLPSRQNVPALTAGMYSSLGIDGLVARDEEEFVSLAVEFANDGAKLKDVSRRICALGDRRLFDGTEAGREWREFLRATAQFIATRKPKKAKVEVPPGV